HVLYRYPRGLGGCKCSANMWSIASLDFPPTKPYLGERQALQFRNSYFMEYVVRKYSNLGTMI
ncbi:MAG: hypothetical protein WA667_13165, partial [Candidatus Nitrosopolaris sp.]